METYKKFVQFLKDEGCAEKYLANVQKYFIPYAKDLFSEELVRILTADSPLLYVCCPFPWRKAPEGTDFWMNVHNRWIQYLRDNGISYYSKA